AKLLQCTKALFDFIKQNEIDKDKLSPLKELIIDNFTHEQIWQELQLQNQPLFKILTKNLKRLSQDRNWRLMLANDDPPEMNSQGNSADSDVEDEESMDHDNDNAEKSKRVRFDIDSANTLESSVTKSEKGNKLKKKSAVDDQFFKLDQMNQFLQLEEQKINDQTQNHLQDDADDDDDIDMFADVDSEDDQDWEQAIRQTAKLVGKSKTSSDKNKKEIKYEDFFDPPPDEESSIGKKSKGASMQLKDIDHNLSDSQDDNDFEDEVDLSLNATFGDDDDDDDNSDIQYDDASDEKENEKLSMHQKRQDQLKAVISDYEEASLMDKPWQLHGEVSARQRPANSLLEEDLIFDIAANKTPVITEEKSLTLEDVIKQRIKDEAWDDVQRKEKPMEQPFEYRKRIELDHEKSKLSLSEIYEKEYLKQTQGVKVQEKPEITEGKELMKSLFAKLDALSNFHFTPKPPKKEIEVVVNAPAISMEEVAPVSVSDAALLAPEEVKAKSRSELKGESEKTTTDKLRERKLRKKSKKLRFKEMSQKNKSLAKVNIGRGSKHDKKEAIQRLKKEGGLNSVSIVDDRNSSKSRKTLSSTTFFDKLQKEAKRDV
ncbi:uncharacterized protein TRIADDRAFT_12205, partial [Trichoplax adhaerens]